MASTWNKLKKSLSFRTSTTSSTPENDHISQPDSHSPPTSSSNSSTSRVSTSFTTRSSKKTCAICLGKLTSGNGQAIFTAECSHSFHFNCIASSVKHGNQICPICRSKWKDIPFQAPPVIISPQRRVANLSRSISNLRFNIPQTIPVPLPQPEAEPHHFSDDEPLSPISIETTTTTEHHPRATISTKALPEFPAISASDSVSEFAVLVGVRAPPLNVEPRCLDRAPIDLVTVLDISGSMTGLKISLLKRAMRFVIQNLSPSDRLAIVSFSSTARRIFPLRKMSDTGREEATLAIDSLSACGGTDIVEGLKKGVRVLEERQHQNPVATIILLSDGKDTYNSDNIHSRSSRNQSSSTPTKQILEYINLLPISIRLNNKKLKAETSQPTFPVHAFGFGLDHDAAVLHAISDASGGTFSFIESTGIIQDAFARCIGGLLSVVAQEVRLTVDSLTFGVHIGSIPSGRYPSEISDCGQQGVIDIGDLYADEGKDFLVYVSVPLSEEGVEKMSLLNVVCSYKDPVMNETVHGGGEIVEIRRPKILSPLDIISCLEVDRERNRLLVAAGIAEAQAMAESGNLGRAQSTLIQQRTTLLSSTLGQSGDGLCGLLEAELREIMERMASTESYEQTGRAYVLSGLSSHSSQRATTRGDSTTTSMTQPILGSAIGYETPSMVNMVTKSQMLGIGPVRDPRLNKSCSFTPRRDSDRVL